MTPNTQSKPLIVIAVVVAFAAGCASSSKTTPQPQRPASTTSNQGGFTSESVPDTTPEPRSVAELGTIYFDYDRSDVRDDARRVLRTNAQTIQGNGSWSSVTIEGHCDERGSEEYNLALGERRATAAKRYLVDLGVPSSRVVTVSFGESSPAVQGHDEAAWHWNRRVEFRVSQ